MKPDEKVGIIICVIIIIFGIGIYLNYQIHHQKHFDEVCQDNNFTEATDWNFDTIRYETIIKVECDDKEIFRVWREPIYEWNKWGNYKEVEYKYRHWNDEWG